MYRRALTGTYIALAALLAACQAVPLTTCDELGKAPVGTFVRIHARITRTSDILYDFKIMNHAEDLWYVPVNCGRDGSGPRIYLILQGKDGSAPSRTNLESFHLHYDSDHLLIRTENGAFAKVGDPIEVWAYLEKEKIPKTSPPEEAYVMKHPSVYSVEPFSTQDKP